MIQGASHHRLSGLQSQRYGSRRKPPRVSVRVQPSFAGEHKRATKHRISPDDLDRSAGDTGAQPLIEGIVDRLRGGEDPRPWLRDLLPNLREVYTSDAAIDSGSLLRHIAATCDRGGVEISPGMS